LESFGTLKDMKCPACSRDLVQIKLPDITVDACKGGCGGIWFEAHELRRVEYQDETEGELLTHLEKDPAITVDLKKKRNCPKCNMIMMQHFSSPSRKVTIDECPKCAGVWLDSGELAAIRSEYKSEAEREKSTEKYFTDVFGSKLALEHLKDEKENEKLRKISKAFSFLTPH
jgi:Zn-finger nucleic acid-binding protein